MKIGILGSGVIGSALAKRFARGGHQALIGSRETKQPSGGETIQRGSYDDAIAHAEIIFLAIGWPYGLSVVQSAGSFHNKILVDVSNPESPDGRSLVVGHTTSGAEEIARAAKDARVLKAFSHFYAELLLEDIPFDGGSPSVLYCGDDPDAKEMLRYLIAGCGFDPIDAGPLASARYLEPLAMLTVHLVREQGWGPTGIAWRLMRQRGDLS